MIFLEWNVSWRSLLVLVTLMVMMSPCSIASSESWTPICRDGKGQAAHMEFVEAGQEEDESAEGVQEGHH